MAKENWSPVTGENFAQVWTLVSKKYRFAKVRYVTEQLICWISGLIFLINALFFTFGWTYRLMDFGSYMDFFLPLVNMWDSFTSAFFTPESSLAEQIVTCILAAYGSPLAVSIVLALLVLIVYHPRKLPVPETVTEESAKQLHDLVKNTKRYVIRRGSKCLLFYNIMFMVFAGVFFSGYALYSIDHSADGFSGISPLGMLLGAFGGFYGYGLLNQLLILITYPLYCRFLPPSLPENVETFVKSFSAGKTE